MTVEFIEGIQIVYYTVFIVLFTYFLYARIADRKEQKDLSKTAKDAWLEARKEFAKKNTTICENCGKSSADLTPVEVEDGKEFQMLLCESCIEDLNTYGEFTHGKYKDWSKAE